MGKKKTTQQQTNQNTYSYMTPPTTLHEQQAGSIADNLRGTINPQIRSQYAGQRQDLNNSFQNPLGAYTTPAVRDATLREGNQNLDQQEGQAMQSADFLANGTDFDRQLALAQMTNPQLVQTGGSMNGTTTQSGGVLAGLLGSAIGATGDAGFVT